MPPREWRLRIRDILAAIDAIEQYTTGLTFETFRDDAKTAQAVAYNLLIIGEAAGAVPDELTAAHAHIPWSKMRGMRNVIVHQYFGVDYWILWQTARSNLPPLIAPLQALLGDPF